MHRASVEALLGVAEPSKVLDHGADILALQSANVCVTHFASQVRVLAVSFLNSAEAQLAREVDDGSEDLVDAEGESLLRDDGAHLADEVRIERAGVGDGAVEDGRVEVSHWEAVSFVGVSM